MVKYFLNFIKQKLSGVLGSEAKMVVIDSNNVADVIYPYSGLVRWVICSHFSSTYYKIIAL